MKLLIIFLLVINIYAKEKNIFFDTKITIPFGGKAYYPDANNNKTLDNSPFFFMGVSLGYSLHLTDDYIIEPSIGYNFSVQDMGFYSQDNIFNYNFYDLTLPLMYYNKGFKGGLYMKYMKIPLIEKSNFYGERTTLFQDKTAYAIGVKAVFNSWFISYEYLLNGNYSSLNRATGVDIRGSYLSLGLRSIF